MLSPLPRHPDHWKQAPQSERRQRAQSPTLQATMALQSSRYIKDRGSPRKNVVLVTVFAVLLVTVVRHLTKQLGEEGLSGLKEHSPLWWGKPQKREGEELVTFHSSSAHREMKGWCSIYSFCSAQECSPWNRATLITVIVPSQ